MDKLLLELMVYFKGRNLIRQELIRNKDRLSLNHSKGENDPSLPSNDKCGGFDLLPHHFSPYLLRNAGKKLRSATPILFDDSLNQMRF